MRIREAVLKFKSRGVQVSTAHSPADCYEFIQKHIGTSVQECMIVLPMTGQNEIVGCIQVALGEVGECRVMPLDILRPVIVAGCNKFVIAHNHPSGSCIPSSADLAFTAHIEHVCEMLGVTMLDHIVVSADGFVSVMNTRR